MSYVIKEISGRGNAVVATQLIREGDLIFKDIPQYFHIFNKNVKHQNDVKCLCQHCSLYFIKWTICFAVLIAVPLVCFDSFMFGKLVLAPLNIVLYNVFPSNANMGPDLYGREPISYYFINCFILYL